MEKFTITIISGVPGSGKTTLAKSLAERSEKGVHVVTDDFFEFVKHKLDPSLPGSELQNAAILNAWANATAAYQDAGYEVFVDGVIGPWWFDQLKEKFGAFRFVLLSCDLQESLGRVSNRRGQSAATTDVVRRMHEKFSAIEVNFPAHCLDTSKCSAEQVLTAFDTVESRVV